MNCISLQGWGEGGLLSCFLIKDTSGTGWWLGTSVQADAHPPRLYSPLCPSQTSPWTYLRTLHTSFRSRNPSTRFVVFFFSVLRMFFILKWFNMSFLLCSGLITFRVLFSLILIVFSTEPGHSISYAIFFFLMLLTFTVLFWHIVFSTIAATVFLNSCPFL